MLKYYIILLLTFLTTFSYSQIKNNEIYDIVEVQPQFKGGPSAMYEYLGNEIIYPLAAQNNKIEDKVYVQFIVNKKGKIKNVTIIKGEYKILNDEAARVIRSMPKWKPGRQKGKKVSVRYTIPINFIIN